MWPVNSVLFDEPLPMFMCQKPPAKLLKQMQAERQSTTLLMDKLISFYEAPDPHLKHKVRYLNPTLGGYLNKILSFWLIKRPEQFLNYVI